MSSPARDILIIGFGNPLRGDDDAGPEAARRLARHGLRTIASHQLTPELSEPVAGADEVWFLDADSGLEPGEVSVASVNEAAAGPLEHHATPAALLRLAREVYGKSPKAWLVGLGGTNFELSEHLSPEAYDSVTRCERLILQAVGLQEVIPCTNPD